MTPNNSKRKAGTIPACPMDARGMRIRPRPGMKGQGKGVILTTATRGGLWGVKYDDDKPSVMHSMRHIRKHYEPDDKRDVQP